MTNASSSSLDVRELILAPVLISFAVTVVRLLGELMEGPSFLFGRAAGGGFALVGMTWLIPVFGYYFGMKLVRAGNGPKSAGKVLIASFLSAVVATFIIGVGTQTFGFLSPLGFVLSIVGAVVGILLPRMLWRELYGVLLKYALAVRIAVAWVMLAAIYAAWGTHYDVVPPGFPGGVSPFATWIIIGLVPQLTFWIMFTVAIGSVFGAIAALIGGRKTAEA